MAVVGAPFKAAKRLALRGAFYTRVWRGLVVAVAWPPPRSRRPTQADLQRRERLTDLTWAVKYATADEVRDAMDSVKGTPFLWRDLLVSQYAGHQIAPINYNGITLYPETFRKQVVRALDTIGGAISGPPVRDVDRWRAYRPAAAGTVFTSNGPDAIPTWQPLP